MTYSKEWIASTFDKSDTNTVIHIEGKTKTDRLDLPAFARKINKITTTALKNSGRAINIGTMSVLHLRPLPTHIPATGLSPDCASVNYNANRLKIHVT
jgi:hypothetical protein